MPLQQSSWTLSDVTGSQETISIDAANTTIAGVSYGVGSAGAPNPVQVSADGKSFQIKVLNGVNALIVTLISPGPDSDVVYIQQKTGSSVVDLDSFVIYRQGIWDPMIQGT
jgi:hypothetical protein